MKRWLWTIVALGFVGAAVAITATAFGKDPHEVPFYLKSQTAPPFSMKRLDNDAVVSLADFANRPVVINFWSTWCGPCKQEHPVLDWAVRKFGNDVVFLGIVFEDNEQNTKEFLKTYGHSMTQLFDPKSTVAVDYGVSGVPETYFLDKNHTIVSKFVGPMLDSAAIEQRIGEIKK